MSLCGFDRRSVLSIPLVLNPGTASFKELKVGFFGEPENETEPEPREMVRRDVD